MGSKQFSHDALLVRLLSFVSCNFCSVFLGVAFHIDSIRVFVFNRFGVTFNFGAIFLRIPVNFYFFSECTTNGGKNQSRSYQNGFQFLYSPKVRPFYTTVVCELPRLNAEVSCTANNAMSSDRALEEIIIHGNASTAPNWLSHTSTKQVT